MSCDHFQRSRPPLSRDNSAESNIISHSLGSSRSAGSGGHSGSRSSSCSPVEGGIASASATGGTGTSGGVASRAFAIASLNAASLVELEQGKVPRDQHQGPYTPDEDDDEQLLRSITEVANSMLGVSMLDPQQLNAPTAGSSIMRSDLEWRNLL